MADRSETLTRLGRAVKRVRVRRGLTQEQVSAASGLHPTYISDIERGARKPSGEAITRLAEGIGVTTADLAAQYDAMAIEASVHRLSNAEHARMVQAGALEGMRVELLDGRGMDPRARPRSPNRIRTPTAIAPRCWVVEVAVTSQGEDARKAPVYARAGIPRYWLVDCTAAIVLEHTDRGPDGYRAVADLSRDATLDAQIGGVTTTTVAALLAD